MKERGFKSFVNPNVTPFQLGVAENLAARLRISGLQRLVHRSKDGMVTATRFGNRTIIKTISFGDYVSVVLYNPETGLNDLYSLGLEYSKSFGVNVTSGFARIMDISTDYITLFWITDHPYVKARYCYNPYTLEYVKGFTYPDKVIDYGGDIDGYLVLGQWSPEWDTDNGLIKHLADPQKHDGAHTLWLFLYKAGVYTGKSISYTCTDTHFSVPNNITFQTDGMYITSFDADIVDAEELGYVYSTPIPPLWEEEERRYVYDHRTNKTIIRKYDYDFNLLKEIEWNDYEDFAYGGAYEPVDASHAMLMYFKVENARWYKSERSIGNYYPIPGYSTINNATGRIITGYTLISYFRAMNKNIFTEGVAKSGEIVPFQAGIDYVKSICQWDWMGHSGLNMWFMIGTYGPPLGLTDRTAYIYQLNTDTLKWSETIKTVLPTTGYYLYGQVGGFEIE